ncbi:MAG: serine--tRNA ligase [Acidobacteriota bacterium]
MLPRDLLRSEPDAVRRRLATRGFDTAEFDRWLETDEAWRALVHEDEELKRERNDASKRIGLLKREGKDADEAIAQVSRIKERLSELDARRDVLAAQVEAGALRMPNLAHPTVPEGPDESANREERRVGEPPQFDFEPEAHWDLGPRLGILDFERAAKLAGARFAVAFGLGARMERALAQLMLDLHTEEHGYLEVHPPFLAHAEALVGTGQLPKFADDLFRVEPSGHLLIPTAEVPLTNLHRDEIVHTEDLPLRYTAHTPCFRAEAGSYGRDVRGLIRQHQFHKVELVQLVEPERSDEALEELTHHAERVLQRLELPYRVLTLSTGDMGFAARKTYDLEVWLPGQQAYREISSCSNCGDFQARRAHIRHRPAGGGKTHYVHTLNGSGLAVGRTLIAVLENYQRADGSVEIPGALRPYLGGLDAIPAPAG